MGLFDSKNKELSNIPSASHKEHRDSISSSSPSKEHGNIPYKRRKSLIKRKQEVEIIRRQFPNKIPVIVERHKKEKTLPLLDKPKFLVPQELTMSQFVTIIRERMQLSYNQTFYLLINGRAMALMSLTLSELYNDYRDDDGFLYMAYASQEAFG